MHDRCSQETRNKQTPETGPQPVSREPLPVLLPQDPTVCQTLNHPNPRPTVPGHRTPKGKDIRTSCRHVPPGTYPLIFHP